MIVDGLSAGVGAVYMRKNEVVATPQEIAHFQS
jgi:hypothetical protein